MYMPEITLWWIMDFFKNCTKYLKNIAILTILILPFGIPILILISLIRMNKDQDRSQ